MLLSLLGSSLLNNGFSWDTVKSLGVGMVSNLGNAIPGLLGSIGQTGKRLPSYGDTMLGRGMLNINRSIADVNIANKTKNILKKARAAQGTISAYLAGRGFEQGGSTAMILSDQNYNNAMSDIEIASLDSDQRILAAEVKQLQGEYSMMNNFEASYFSYQDPMTKFIKESFVQPMIRQNLSEIGGKVNTAINRKFKESPSKPQETGSFVQPLISNSWMK